MRYFSKKRFTMRQVVGLLTVVFLGIAVIAYAAVTVPNPDFIAGQPISSDQVDANFTALGNAMPAVKANSTAAVCITVTTVSSDIQTLDVTPPVNGYIILSGTGYGAVRQTAVAYNYAWISLSTTVGGTSVISAFGIDTTGATRLSNALDSLYITNVFPVTGGTPYTFRITAYRDSTALNTVQICQAHLTAIFVPSLL